MENQNLPYLIYGNERAIIDTGSPTSFGKIKHINILGDLINLKEFPPQVAQCMPANTVALLGMDILRNYDISINNNSKEGVFSKEQKEELGNEIIIGEDRGVPTFRAIINNNEVDCYFDTGAAISYIDPAYIRGANPILTMEDCYPGNGVFPSKIYKVNFDIEGFSQTIQIGVLPANLQNNFFNQGKVKAIIGLNIFPRQERFLLSFRRKKIFYIDSWD